MNPLFDAFLLSWPVEPWVTFFLLLSAIIYLRGWLVLRRRDPFRWTWRKPAAFCGGLGVLFLALASPIEPFSSLFLQVHMLQHLLLMMAAPPLIWLGAPFFPMLRGLPQPIRAVWVIPLLRWQPLRWLFQKLTEPVLALPLFVAATWIWHLPAIYELALRSNYWHYLQHACFLLSALLFWYLVIRPYPSRPAWSLWLLVPFLLVADVQNTALSALLTFSAQPLYPYYEQILPIAGITPQEDQAAAGVLMWVPGTLAYLIPLFWIGVKLLYGRGDHREAGSEPMKRVVLPLINQHIPVRTSHPPPALFDVLRIPGLGRFLRWRQARPAMQIVLFIVAGVLIYDGLTGPQVGAMNLAGVVPWIHWRGLVIIALLAAGNLFCMGCPFLLPRTLGRRWLSPHRVWPRRLRSKWVAVGLLITFLWAYEAFALWDSPWWTAWIALGYFAGAFVVDGFFRGASFCKYLCPIGQFNFVQSLVSPVEIKVREEVVCSACKTKDCIKGRDGIPGCELDLYLPRKVGNLDCTFCLDCIHACPHDNIGILSRTPAAELWQDPQRSSIGQFSRRTDFAALVVLLTFGAFANAAAMTGPVVEWEAQLGSWMGCSSLFIWALYFLVFLVISPVLLMVGAGFLSRSKDWLHAATRFSLALAPLGFAMWLTHYSFHFFTSNQTVIPASQRFILDLGGTFLGSPEWQGSCCLPVADWLLRLEIMFLDLGLLLSLYTCFRIARTQTDTLKEALKLIVPWAALLLLLFAAGIWIVFQPMQMRGMLPA